MIPLPAPGAADVCRFWSHVSKSEQCWIWTGDVYTNSGYGRISVSGRRVRAHRVSWLLAAGQDPGPLLVLHRCDTPACVRPDHLFLGTNTDNMRDKARKGRARNEPHRGSSNGFAKLNETNVQLIRERRAAGATAAALSREFNVSITTISNVTTGLSWRHVPAARAA